MAVKTNGAEFKRFYNDTTIWPEDQGDTYHEDEVVVINGKAVDELDVSTLADTDALTLSGGVVYSPSWPRHEAPSFETYFKRWRAKQREHYVVVKVDAAKLDAVKAALSAMGVTVY